MENLRFCTANDPVSKKCTAFTDVLLASITGGAAGNAPSTGTPVIAGAAPITPVVATPLTAGAGTIADTNGIALITFAWEVETTPGVWNTVGLGPSYTPGPADIGHALRVAASVLDNIGGFTVLRSGATSVVVDGVVTAANRPATGTPVVTDVIVGGPLAGRPRIGDPLGVDTSGIADPDGLVGVTLNFQWQQSANGTTWTNILGATASGFIPTQDLLGRFLRVHVFFNDQLGSLEQLDSAATLDVRLAKRKTTALLALGRATVPPTITAAGIATRGVTVTLTAPTTTTIVRVRVFRGNAKIAAATAFINVKPGTHTVTLHQAAIMRVLKRGGTFRIEMTPGTSRTHLGTATVRRINVHRGK
jgi:hypothetical protein